MTTVRIDGRKLMQNLTVTVDTTHLDRQAFGWLHWRRRSALLLMRLAVRILGCNVELVGKDDEA